MENYLEEKEEGRLASSTAKMLGMVIVLVFSVIVGTGLVFFLFR